MRAVLHETLCYPLPKAVEGARRPFRSRGRFLPKTFDTAESSVYPSVAFGALLGTGKQYNVLFFTPTGVLFQAQWPHDSWAMSSPFGTPVSIQRKIS